MTQIYIFPLLRIPCSWREIAIVLCAKLVFGLNPDFWVISNPFTSPLCIVSWCGIHHCLLLVVCCPYQNVVTRGYGRYVEMIVDMYIYIYTIILYHNIYIHTIILYHNIYMSYHISYMIYYCIMSIYIYIYTYIFYITYDIYIYVYVFIPHFFWLPMTMTSPAPSAVEVPASAVAELTARMRQRNPKVLAPWPWRCGVALVEATLEHTKNYGFIGVDSDLSWFYGDLMGIYTDW